MGVLWPLEKFCNLLRLSLQDYVSNGTRTTRISSVSDGLRSVGGPQVASGWLMQNLLELFVLASG